MVSRVLVLYGAFLVSQVSSECNPHNYMIRCAEITVNKQDLVVGDMLVIQCHVVDREITKEVVIMDKTKQLLHTEVLDNTTVRAIVPALALYDTGSYVCCRRNCSGYDDMLASQFIRVGELPTASKFTCRSIKEDHLECSWESSSQQWSLLYRKSEATCSQNTTQPSSWMTAERDDCVESGNKVTCTLNATFGCTYDLQLHMHNLYGSAIANHSVSYDIGIVDDVLTGDVSAVVISATDTTLQWSLHVPEYVDDAVCQLTSISQWGDVFNKTLHYRFTEHGLLTRDFNLTRLHPYTDYDTFLSCSVTGSLYTGAMSTMSFTTRESAPLIGANITNSSYVVVEKNTEHYRDIILYKNSPSQFYAQGVITSYIVSQRGRTVRYDATSTIRYRFVEDVGNNLQVWAKNEVGRSLSCTCLRIPSKSEVVTVIKHVTVELKGDNSYLVSCWTKQSNRNSFIFHYCNGNVDNSTNTISCVKDYNFIRSNSSQMTITTRSRDVYFAVSADYPEPSDGLHWQDCVYTYDTTGGNVITPARLLIKNIRADTVTVILPRPCDENTPRPHSYILHYVITQNKGLNMRHETLQPVPGEDVRHQLTDLLPDTNYSVWYQVVYRDHTKSRNSSSDFTFVTQALQSPGTPGTTVIVLVSVSVVILVIIILGVIWWMCRRNHVLKSYDFDIPKIER